MTLPESIILLAFLIFAWCNCTPAGQLLVSMVVIGYAEFIRYKKRKQDEASTKKDLHPRN